MSEVKLKNISKNFGEKNILHDINLDIKDKEFCVLVGASGCGKSTLLRIIAGLETPTIGEIFIGGKKMNDVSPKDRNIAFVFQSYALYPHLNVYDNIAFPLKVRKLDKNEIKKRVSAAAEILGLGEFLKRKPKELSGGQRQRVALGRAIVREPSVFLMDEPLSNLDAKLRVAMRSEIKKLHEKLQTTFIYVTHDQTEALTMGDKVVVLNEGNIVQQGTPKEIFNSPDSTFVATFMGALPMNIIPKDGKLMGFRPDDMIFGGDGDIVFEVKPDFEEILGCDKIVYFEIEGVKCCAKINADDDTKGIIKLSVPAHKIIFFDANTKKRLI